MFAVLIAMLVASQQPASSPLDAVPQTRLEKDLRCLLGVYSLPAGKSVTITGNGGQPRGLRYTLSNGQFGTLTEGADGTFTAGKFAIDFEPCSSGALSLTRGRATEQAVRIQLVEKETTFISDGVALHGKLVLPANRRADYAAVWIEGSNNNPSTDDAIWQYELACRGIATFVYDKRGTGASGGTLSSDFYLRARDTAAAVKEIRRMAPHVRNIGVIGGSQGGWVAPLVATLVPLDFVIPAFAMAEGPIAQDQELVQLQLRKAGFDAAILADARELTAITANIVRSNASEAFADLDAFKAKHAGAPWLKAIQPRSYTGLFLQFSSDQIKAAGPAMAQGLSFDYEPRPVIERIQPRQLWLFAGNDQQAPSENSQAILRQAQWTRPQIAVVVFPNADHGMIERIKTDDGDAMAFSERLFDITADWIRTQRLPAKGNFLIMPVRK
jgi:uncharacterized protein